MRRYITILIPVALLALGAVIMVLFLGMREEPPRRPAQSLARIVETRIVNLGSVEATISAFGTAGSSQPIDLFSQVRGELVAGDVPFLPAQEFEHGDVLVRIDDRQVRLDRNAAISDLLNALANALPEIKTDFPDEYPVWQAYFNLVTFDKTIPPLPDAANQKIKLYLSRFNVYRLYFTVKDLEIVLEKHAVTALFSGSVVSTNLRVGSTARDGTLLGSIINTEEFEVELPVPASEIAWIDFDAPLLLRTGDSPVTLRGKMKRVGQAINERTQTVPLYIGLDKLPQATLFEGAFFEVDIPGVLIDEAYEVPRSAVYEDGYVYLITDGKLEYRQVGIARRQRETVVISSGLAQGDTLVIEPLQGVSSGMPALPRSSLNDLSTTEVP